MNSDRLLFASLTFLALSVALFFLGRGMRPAISDSASILACQQTDESSPEQPVPNNEVMAPQLDFDSHVAKLREEHGDKFTIVVEKPFVVIGDQSPRDVKQWASSTIRWSVARIKESYFEKDPDHIINIWLFKDKQSYDSNAKQLFGSVPTTPYGYYSPSDKALVMNISTGGGTLVHEIVHPFMEANFERCPSWFNEGLASLYEQSSERNGKIVGLTNWRLRALQLSIKDGFVGTFEKMMSTTDRGFYEGDSTNYAQARYLCYWLQEQGVLEKYYHSFVKNADDDPEGIETLKAIIATEDLDKFQKAWEAYVLKLRF